MNTDFNPSGGSHRVFEVDGSTMGATFLYFREVLFDCFLSLVIRYSSLIHHSGFLIRHYYRRVGSYPTRLSFSAFNISLIRR